MRRRLVSHFAPLLFAIALDPSPLLSEDTPLGKQVSNSVSWNINDAIAGWKRIEEGSHKLRATIEISRETGSTASKAFSVVARAEIKQCRDCILVIYTDQVELDLQPNDHVDNRELMERSRAYVVNHDYSFSVRRVGSSSAWVLTKMARPGDESLADARTALNMTSGIAAFGAISFCDGTSILEICARKDFVVERIRYTDSEGTPIAIIEFTLKERNLNKLINLKRGWMYCDPDRNFAICRTEMDVISPTLPTELFHVRRDVDYDEAGEVSRLTTTTTSTSRKHEFREISHVKSLDHVEAPETDFRLTAFDLPEVPLGQMGSMRYVLIGVGLFLLVAGVVLWHQRQGASNS